MKGLHSPGGDDHVILGRRVSVAAPDLIGNGLAEFVHACVGHVLGLPVSRRPVRSLHYVRRCREIRLADLEVDDVPCCPGEVHERPDA